MEKLSFVLLPLVLAVCTVLVSCASLFPKPESPLDTLLLIIVEKEMGGTDSQIGSSFSHLDITIEGQYAPASIGGARFNFVKNQIGRAHV